MLKKVKKYLGIILTLALLVSSISGISPRIALAAEELSSEVIFEAEDGVLSAPMEVSSGLTGASGSYISVAASNPMALGPFDAGAASEALYSVSITKTASYNVWARVHMPSTSSDSFFYTFDDIGQYTAFYGNVNASWQWVKINGVGLSQGIHNFKIKYRDTGMSFDRFVITRNLTYVPSGVGTNPSAVNDPVLTEKTYSNPYALPSEVPPAGEHPRLFVRSSDIPKIRENITKEELKKIWTNVINTCKKNYSGALPPPAVSAGASNYDDDVRKVIEANALLYLINEDAEAGQRAVSMMENFLITAVIPLSGDSTRRMGQTITTGSIVYDWCYDLMTDAQRLIFRLHMERIATNMEIGYPPTGQNVTSGHGAEAQLLRDLLSFGIAAYDENPRLYELAAGRFFQEYVPQRNYTYASEWQHPGDSYGMYRFQWDMFATWIFGRMGAGNVFAGTQQAKVPYQYIYARRGDGQLLRDGDTFSCANFSQGQYWANDIVTLLLTSNYYKDSILKEEFLKEYSYGTANWQLDDIYMVLFDDPDIALPGTGTNTLPLSKYFGDPEAVMIARTGWDGGLNSSAVTAQMKIGGTYFAGHQHLDAGSFQIYYKGGLAIDSGVYQGPNGSYGSSPDLNYNKRTIAHNSMLVYKPGEAFKYYGTSLTNDGGQRTPNNLAEPANLDTLLDPAKGYDVADVLKHSIGSDAYTPDYSYIKGDLTKAYSSKVSDYKRSMVFLNMKDLTYPAVMLVYDKLTASDAGYKKTWLLHSQTEPEVAGDTTTIRRNDSGFNGKLVNKSLLPLADNLAITKVGGPGYEYWVNGYNYFNTANTADNNPNGAETGAWRIEVSPGTASATDEFLNVMQVMDDAGGPAPMAVEKVDGDKVVGAKVEDRVVLFGKQSQTVGDSLTFTANGGESDIYYLITDLAEGYWTAVKSGETAAVQYQVSADEGVLYFTGSAGTYTLTRSDTLTLPLAPPVPNIPMPVQNTIEMKLDGVTMTNELRAEVVSGTVMLPAEKVLAALGARIEEAVAAGTLTAQKLGKRIDMTVGSNDISVNGKTITMEKPPLILNDRVYIPMGYIAETAWGTASWDSFKKIVSITSIKPVANNGLEAVTTSEGGAYSGENTIDGDMTSKWTAAGDNAWICYDLGSAKPVNRIGIAWYKGNERSAVFEIQVSSDGSVWTTVYSGQSSGATSEMEDVIFDNTRARYVKIVGHGFYFRYGLIRNNAISEIALYTQLLEISGVTAISETPGNEAATTLDGNIASYWAAEGDGKWIQYDLGTIKTVTGVGTAWIRSDVRQQIYDILVSTDGTTWKTVFSGRNSGTTLQMEYVYFNDAQGRYVRILGHGNSVSGWNSLAEAKIFGIDYVDETAATISAEDIKFTDEAGNAISTLVPGGTVVVAVPLANNGSKAQNVMLAASLFKGGILTGTNYDTVILQPGEVRNIELNVSLPPDITGCFLKVHLWDGLQHPIIPAAVFAGQDLTLQSISIEGVPLEGFDPYVFYYTVDPSRISSSGVPQVTAVSNSPTATVQIEQAESLEGTATITVADNFGNPLMVYRIKFHVKAKDATLKDLRVDGTTIAGFSGEITEYTYQPASNVIPLITATANDNNATVTVTQALVMPGAAVVTVRAEDGETVKQYTVGILGPEGTDATLKDLRVEGITIEGFAGDITAYTYNQSTTEVPEITAVANDAEASVVVTQAAGVPGVATVTVTSQNGETSRQYTVNIILVALSNDATLKDLKVGSSTIAGFSGSKTAYTYNYIPYEPVTVSSIPKIAATSTNSLATVSITQAKTLPDTAVVTVTAEDGITVKVYTVNINTVNVNGSSYIMPSDDAYVSVYEPDKNFNDSESSQYLAVMSDKMETYMKFKVSGITGNVSTAVLNMRAQMWSETATLSVYASDNDSWTETDLTWNNRPAAETLLGTIDITTAWQAYSIDIKSLIQPLIAANQANPGSEDEYVTLVVRSSSANGGQICSRSKDFFPAYLKITTTTQASTDATLKDLKVNGTTIPGFAAETTVYNHIQESTDVTAITATANDANATVVVIQATEVPGTATVAVTAQDGVTTKLYAVNITLQALSTDATLRDLKVGGSTIAGFSSSDTDYNFDYIPAGLPSIASFPQISAIATDPLAQVSVTQVKSLPGCAVVTVIAQDSLTTKQYIVTFNSINVNGHSLITASEDAHVSSTNTSANYGTGEFLNVRSGRMESYIKYNISGVAGNITSAALKIRAQMWTGTATLSVYYAEDDSWTETGINWGNKPAAGNFIGSFDITTAWTDCSFDITDLVKAMLAANENAPEATDVYISVVVQSSSVTDTAQLAAHERSYYPPYLAIEAN